MCLNQGQVNDRYTQKYCLILYKSITGYDVRKAQLHRLGFHCAFHCETEILHIHVGKATWISFISRMTFSQHKFDTTLHLLDIAFCVEPTTLLLM